ncbi:MAG: MarR family winged helix-turn-helix transcriptional regulator [Flavobacteriaceae bacterium]
MKVTMKKVIIRMLKTNALIEEQLNAAIKSYAVSLPQFNVLRILRGNQKQPASLSTLQEKMIKPMSNTTRLVDKLVDKGLVRREICSSNRRKVDIRITNKGLEMLTKLDQSIDQAETQLMSALTPEEMKTLFQLIEKMQLSKK